MPGGEIWWNENMNSFISNVRIAIESARPEIPPYDMLVPSFWMSDIDRKVELSPSERDTFIR